MSSFLVSMMPNCLVLQCSLPVTFSLPSSEEVLSFLSPLLENFRFSSMLYLLQSILCKLSAIARFYYEGSYKQAEIFNWCTSIGMNKKDFTQFKFPKSSWAFSGENDGAFPGKRNRSGMGWHGCCLAQISNMRFYH